MSAPLTPPDYREAIDILFRKWFYVGQQTYFDQYVIDTTHRVMHIASPRGRVKCRVKYDPTQIPT